MLARALALALVLLALLAYAPVLGNGFVDFDDDLYLLHNPALRRGLTPAGVAWAFTSGSGANWFPLTWLSWMADYTLFGLDARAFHATSLLLHVASAVSLLALLARATGALWPAAFVAGVFALHPLHVESVAWAAARKDVLSGLLWVLTTLAYLRYASRPGPGRYALVALGLLAGLMAKPMLVTLPFTLLLLDVWPLRRLPLDRWDAAAARRLCVEKLPLAALSLLSAVVTLLVQRASGAVAAEEVFPPATRLLNAAVSYVAYLGDAFWPAGLAPYYPHPGPALSPLSAALAALGLLGLTLAAFALRRMAPAVLVGWLFYLGTLVPVIGLVQVGEQARADRYTYIPLVGIAVALAWGVPPLAARLRLPAMAPAALGGLALLLCVPLTARQVLRWRDSVTLFEHTLRVTGPNALAHVNLGVAYLERGRLEDAVRELEAAVRLHPGSAEGHGALAGALARLGRHADARAHFETSLRLFPAQARVRNAYGRSLAESGEPGAAGAQFREAIALDPAYAEPYGNLGAVLMEQGSPDALDYLEKAVSLDPGLAEARANWGRALLGRGEAKEAAEHLAAAEALSPGRPGVLRDWGFALLAQRDFEAALARFREAVGRAPDDGEAEQGAGLALAHLGRYEAASTHLARAAVLRPRDPEPLHALGMALAGAGDLAGAVQRYRAALALDPARAEVHNSLGIALGSLRRIDEALAHLRRAAELRPDYAEAFNNWGLALASRGSIRQAVARLRRAVDLSPGYADARNNLGVFLARLGDLEEAAEQFREVLRLDPGRQDARENLARIRRVRSGSPRANPPF
jgi:Flp pilus assembly protein TadD